MDIAQIIGLFGTSAAGLASATATAESLKNLVGGGKGSPVEVQSLVLDLYNHLIDAKSSQSKLEDMLLKLQRELRERHDFEADAARYALHPAGRGTLLYTLKPGDPLHEPPHKICGACYAVRKKVIVQPHPERHNTLYCPLCRAEYLSEGVRGDGPSVLTGRGPGDRFDDF